ncbi:MAG: zinc ribbon domain-containing protein [Thermodesulfobacteriota bacterium]|nr:zinc ribbon domain-containing protein [Thermodesulfobacteriota bacterium]
MPLFDFICQACGKKFETLVMGRDKPVCPECKSGDLKKLMSTFSHKTDGKSSGESSFSGSGSSCAGCAGGNCATCH